MSTLVLALQIVEALEPLAGELMPAIASLRQMTAEGRDPTAAEIAAQAALIAQLRARLAAG